MAELTKTKVIDIQTGSATKNVDNLTKSFVPLKKQIKDLIVEMGQLTKGTKEYDEAALKLAELQQKQREITEAAKYSNRDFGAVMSNLTKVSVGLVGGINALSASMAMLSSDSEEVQKALQKIQLVMAVIQGFSALDNALKSLKGLFNAFGGVTTEAELAAKSIGDLNDEMGSIGDKTIDLTVEADTTEVEKVKADIDSIESKDVFVEVDSDTTGVKEAKTEIESVEGKEVDIVVDSDTSKVSEVKEAIDSVEGKEVEVSVEADSSSIETLEGEIDSISGRRVDVDVEADSASIDSVKTDIESIGDKKVSVDIEADKSSLEAVKNDLETITDKTVHVGVDADTSGVDEVKSELNTIKDETVKVKIDTGDAARKTSEVKAELEAIGDETVTITVDNTESVVATEETRTEIESLPDTHNTDITVTTGEAIPQLEAVRAEIESIPETKVVSVEGGGVDEVTDSVKKLSKAEGEAAKTANTLGKANNVLSKTSKGVVGGLKAIATGLKNAAKAMIQFIASNPYLAAIAAAIAAVAGGIALLNKKLEEQGRVAKEEADILSQVNSEYKDQTIRLNVLLNTAKDANQSLEERKKAVEELNKIVPEYNAQIDETTGLYHANNEALETYINNLRQKLMLEAYEGKIKEYLQKQLELEEEINEIENTGWWFVKKRIRSRREEIAQIGNDVDRLYGKIQNLDLGAALADNKVETKVKKTTSGVNKQIKLIADAIKELKKIVVDLWDTFYNNSVRKFTGPIDSFRDMREEIESVMKKFDLAELVVDSSGNAGYKAAAIFTKQFTSFLVKGTKSIWSSLSDGFNASMVFNEDTLKKIDDLKKQAGQYAGQIDLIINKYEKLAKTQGGKLTEAQAKQFETQKKGYEDNLKKINDELNAYDLILKAVKEYADYQMDVKKAEEESSLATIKHNQQLAIEEQYFKELKAGNPMADANRNLASMENELDATKRMNDALKNRLEVLKANTNGNELYSKEIKELQDQIVENERSIQDQQLQIDITSYNKRLQEAQNYFAAIEQAAANQINQVTIDNGGKNTGKAELEKQRIEMNAIKEKMDYVRLMYEQGLITQEEYNARSLELSAQLAEAEQQINEQRMQNFANTTGQIVNVFQSLAGSVTSVLQEMMEGMDEGSEEYKRLAITTAIIQTLSGTLGAFMSGVNSGIPAPYNLILAAVMAASTAAVGAIQIAKIKQGTDSSGGAGQMSSAAASVGQGTYETMAYQQNTELLGNVADQRVYVLEHDISASQQNVQVRENNTTY